MPCIASPTVPRTAPAPSSLDGAISGSVTLDGGSTPLGGGEVWVYNAADTLLLDEVVIDGSGDYAVSDLTPATYRLRYMPPDTHSIGASESDFSDVVVSAGSTATQHFKAQPAWFWNGMQGLTNDTDLVDGDTTPVNAGSPWFGLPGCDFIQMAEPGGSAQYVDATGGPGGTQAWGRSWPARPTCPDGCSDSNCNYSINGIGRGLFPGLNTASQLWYRIIDFYDPDFRTGGGESDTGVPCSGTGALEYKSTWLQIITSLGGSTVDWQFNMENASGGLPGPSILGRVSIVNNNGGAGNVAGTRALGVIGGTWQSFIGSLTGLGTSQQTFNFYAAGDKNPSPSLTTSMLDGESLNGQMYVSCGLNINNGPSQPQFRLVRGIGIYKSRPSLKQGVQD